MLQTTSNHTSLAETYVSEATEYLNQINCSEYTADECFRVNGAWYGVNMSAEDSEPFCVYVRHTANGVELRDNRVLQELNRQMRTLTQELANVDIICIPWVRFISEVPMQAWAAKEMLQDVNDADALTTEWYILFREEQRNKMLDLSAELAVQLGSRGYIGTIYTVVAEEKIIEDLSVSPNRETCVSLAQNSQRIRVNTDSSRTKEVILTELSQ